MKNKITKIIVAVFVCLVIGVAAAIIIPNLKKDNSNPIELIGIGGGGAFFNAKIPNYYCILQIAVL